MVVIPRADALGYFHVLPEREKVLSFSASSEVVP
jgi:hypothetical protein